MRLSVLRLRHFRNLGVQDLDVPPEGVAIIGDNAQGKSNLLEAIYYLETFRSFRGARDRQLIAFDEPLFRIAGALESSSGKREVSAAFQAQGKRKKVTVDGAEMDRLTDGLGQLAAVVFSPTDVEMITGGPAERRRFLDIVLSLSDARYLQAIQEYRQSLARRNAALKAGHPSALVRAWDPGLVRAGACVIERRRRWVERMATPFREYHSAVAGGMGASMRYRSSVDVEGASSEEDIVGAFGEALKASHEREVRLGTTVVGPHRDELVLRLDEEGGGLDLREYGSGGQRRTAALALRLVEARTIREVRGQDPVILLDDVFAELDAARSERILHLMEREETGQVILTAPKESDVRVRRDALPRWSIAGGRIEA
ncbi:MAG: DNA replication/repair protein RecF [Gemmatimonadota bacterium]|nr:DNA replication/repair protein RecF [Gemmatimonadota bacterium]